MDKVLLSAYINNTSAEPSGRRLRFLEGLRHKLRERNLDLQYLDLSCGGPPGHSYFPMRKISINERLNSLRSIFGGRKGFERDAIEIEKARLSLTEQLAFWKIEKIKLFYREHLDRLKPRMVLMWNQFTAQHLILSHLAAQRGIPYGYLHLGVLPGSIALEFDGQMAESEFFECYEEYSKLPLAPQELEFSRSFLDKVSLGEFNRKTQPSKGVVKTVLEKNSKKGKVTIFYAGQNDFQSGLYPPGTIRSRKHSPFFTGTLDALVELNSIAEDNDWRILFKPHPNCEIPETLEMCNLMCVDLVKEGNIFECIKETDITTTILSQVSYQAMILNKPVVMLGLNPISPSGCVYQLNARNKVVYHLKEALQKGISTAMGKMWIEHITILRKYFLFRYDLDLDEYFPRKEDSMVQNILKNI